MVEVDARCGGRVLEDDAGSGGGDVPGQHVRQPVHARPRNHGGRRILLEHEKKRSASAGDEEREENVEGHLAVTAAQAQARHHPSRPSGLLEATLILASAKLMSVIGAVMPAPGARKLMRVWSTLR